MGCRISLGTSLVFRSVGWPSAIDRGDGQITLQTQPCHFYELADIPSLTMGNIGTVPMFSPCFPRVFPTCSWCWFAERIECLTVSDVPCYSDQHGDDD